MEPFAAILFVVSCQPNMMICREESAPTAFYETVEQCDVARKLVTRTLKNQDHITLGQCIEVPAELLKADAELVWSVDPTGHLSVDFLPLETTPRQVARAN